MRDRISVHFFFMNSSNNNKAFWENPDISLASADKRFMNVDEKKIILYISNFKTNDCTVNKAQKFEYGKAVKFDEILKQTENRCTTLPIVNTNSNCKKKFIPMSNSTMKDVV